MSDPITIKAPVVGMSAKNQPVGAKPAAKSAEKPVAEKPAPSTTRVETTTIRVSRSVKSSGESEQVSEHEQIIEVHRFATEPARVNIEVPLKKTKNYSSLGITIGVSMPCYVEEIPEALDRAYKIVNDRVQAELPEVIAGLDSLARD